MQRPLFFGLVFALATFDLQAQQAPLDLAGVFGAVEKVNVNVLVSRESVSQAIGLAGQQRANLLPRVNLDAQQKRSS